MELTTTRDCRVGMADFAPALFVVLDSSGEQLHVERPAGERYCNFTLLSVEGRVQCYLSGYAAVVNIVPGHTGATPFLRVGNASIPLPVERDAIRQLADYIGVPYTENTEVP